VAWTDQHCHLEVGDAGASQVAEARAAGVTRMVSVGCDLAQSQQMAELAAIYDGVYATAGVHPHDAQHGIAGIEALLDLPQVVAVGEAGLDYFYEHSPRDVQADVFAAQIALANQRSLPLVIHSRDAWDDTFAMLDREGVPDRTVFHCFTGGPDEATEVLNRGALLSFSGIISFPSGESLRQAAAICPLDRLLVETDSPYLAPVPHRGKPNQPAWVRLVGEAVAAAVGRPVAEIEAVTWQNANRFYDLDEVDAAKAAR
jgi:TatD DNase family protein